MAEEDKREEQEKEKGIRFFYRRHRALIWEIFRFLVVGGLATLVDWVVCYFADLWIPEIKCGNWSVDKTLATTCGFICGLILNYVLSIVFVYRNKKDESEGKSVRDFLVFTVIGVGTLLISYLGIYLLSDLCSIAYMIARIIMTAVGLVLNYLGRKFLIFK